MRFKYLWALPVFLLSAAAFSFELDFYRDKFRVYTHEVDVNVVYSQDSRWSPELLKEHFEEAAQVYAQCGVRLNVGQVEQDSGPSEIYFDLEGYVAPDDPRPAGSALNLAKTHRKGNSVTAIFFEEFDMGARTIMATAVPRQRISQKDQEEALNTVWITGRVEYDRQFTPEEGGYPNGYNVLAHELGHVLLNDGHVNDYGVHNLMHESMYYLNGRLDLAQCERIKKSELVREVEQPLACSAVRSPLRAQVEFQYGHENCAGAEEIIEKLEGFHDRISDLNPVSGMDFYFYDTSQIIQYQDKNIFEGSLNISYDHYRDRILRQKQSDVLWLHELGHAIFNAQLVADWPWYAGRMENYREWNRLIRERESDGIFEIISKINSYPDSEWIDPLIAPYHELFSDMAATIYFDDPKILSYALSPPDDLGGERLSESERRAIEERNYSIERDWKTWEELEVHGMLAPAGGAVWKKIERLKKRGYGKKALLRFVFDAIFKEIQERVLDPKLREIGAPEANRRLIEKVQD